MSDWISEIERLSQLKESGALSDGEYEAAKARVLATKEGKVSEDPKAPTPDDMKSLKGAMLSARQAESTRVARLDATWADFINCTEFDDVVGSKHSYYKDKFRKIIDKAGGSRKSIKYSREITSIGSFNLSAFILGNIWAAYRGVAGWQALIGISCFLILFDSFISSAASLSLSVAYILFIGIFGNSLYLKAAANKWASGIPANGVNGSGPSFARVVIFIFTLAVSALISIAIEDALIDKIKQDDYNEVNYDYE